MSKYEVFSGPYFPAFGLNTERYGLSLRIQSECGKMGTRIAPNMDTFYAVHVKRFFLLFLYCFHNFANDNTLSKDRLVKILETESEICSKLTIKTSDQCN